MDVPRRVVVIVIQPDLTDAQHARPVEKILEFVLVIERVPRGVVGMRPEDTEKERILVDETHRGPRRFGVVADVDDRRHTVLNGAPHHGINIVLKQGMVEMSVCVDHVFRIDRADASSIFLWDFESGKQRRGVTHFFPIAVTRLGCIFNGQRRNVVLQPELLAHLHRFLRHKRRA